MRQALIMLLILAAKAASTVPPAIAQSGPLQDLVPEDECILQLDLPPGSVVTLQGKTYGPQSQVRWSNLKPGQMWMSRLKAKFVDGEQVERKILLKSGQRVVMPIRSKKFTSPQLTPQWWSVSKGPSNGLVAFSRDGQLLLDATKNETDGATARLWNIEQSQVIRTFHATSRIQSVAFNKDGSHLVLGLSDATAVLWETATGKRLRTFHGHRGGITAIAFSSDGKKVVTGSADMTVKLWNIETGENIQTCGAAMPLTEIDLLQRRINAVTLSTNGDTILSADEHGKVVEWDASNGQLLRTVRESEPNSDQVLTIFNPDRNLLAICTDFRYLLSLYLPDREQDFSIEIWDTSQNQIKRSFNEFTAPVNYIAFDSSGMFLLASSEDGSAILWPMFDDAPLQKIVNVERFAKPNGFNPSSNLMLVGTYVYDHSAKKSAKLISLRERLCASCILCIEPYFGFSLNQERLVILSLDGCGGPGLDISSWNLISQTPPRIRGYSNYATHARTVGDSNETLLAELLFNQDTFTASASTIKIIDNETGDTLRRFISPRDMDLEPYAVVGSSDKYVLRVGKFRQSPMDAFYATLWDLSTGELLREFPIDLTDANESIASPNEVVVSSDSMYALVITYEGSVLLNLNEGSQITRFESFRENAPHTFAPDGRLVSRSHDSDRLRIWRHGEASNWLEVLTNGAKTSFTKDGSLIVGLDHSRKMMTVWDARSGRSLAEFRDLNSEYRLDNLTTSPDGRILIANGQENGVVHFLSILTGENLLTLHLLGEQWLVTTPEGLYDGSAVAKEQLCYRIGNGLNVVPVDRFEQDFHYPGLLAAIWRGKRPMPKVEIGKTLPPTLRILERSAEDGNTDQLTHTIVIEATDNGGGIKDPWLKHNNALLEASEPPSREGNKLRQTFFIRLTQGQNELKFQSASADGSWESEPVTVNLNYAKPLRKPDLYLLAVGINRYADEAYDLRYAAPDARSMAELFKQKAGGLYAKVHPKLLLDEEATVQNIQDALDEFARTSKTQDTVMVFLAGHGTLVGDRYYFLPHEYRDLPGVSMEGDVKRDGLSQHQINDKIEGCAALKRLLVYDTCQSRVLADLNRDAVGQRALIERLYRNRGTHAIMAVPPGEQAKEHEQLGHGLLSYVLLAAMGGVDTGPLVGKPLKTEDQIVTVRDWFGYAETHVPELMNALYGRRLDPYFPRSEGAGFPVLQGSK